jgi:hypothetical protein
MDPRRGLEGQFTEAPAGTLPRAPWPAADPRKQANIEHSFFEEDATIRFDRLPPIQSWAMGRSEARRTNHIVTSVVRLAMAGHLKLRQEEIDVIADCVARNYNKTAWVHPVSMAIAGGVAYSNRETFRFPFYTPSRTWFNPHVFFSPRVTVLRGPQAMIAWHLLRFGAYYAMSIPPTMFFFDSVAKTSMAATISRDQRLGRLQQSIVKLIQQNSHAPGRARQQQQQIDPPDMQQRDESYRRAGLPPPSPGEVAQRRSPYPPPVVQPAEEWQTQDSQPPVKWGTSEPEQAPQQQQPGIFGRWGSSSPRPAAEEAPAAQQAPRQPEPSRLWDDDDDLLDDDEGSPVSAAVRRAERAQRVAAGSSSWDRVRQQASASASLFARGDRSADDTTWGQLRQDAAPTDRDRDRTPPSQSYTYSDSAASKDPVRAQAQKEFDALVEAERNGEAANRGRRW